MSCYMNGGPAPTVVDALLIRQHLERGLKLSNDQRQRAHFAGAAEITDRDAQLVLEYCAGLVRLDALTLGICA